MKINYSLTFLLFLFILFSCEKNEITDECNLIADVLAIDSVKINRKVLVIGLDGVRSDAIQENSSAFLHSLSVTNEVYYTESHKVELITYSGPNWSSILTGVHYAKHQVDDNSFANPNYSMYPTFFEYIEEADSTINTVSIVNWTPINTHILSTVTDFSPQTSINDLQVYEQAQNLLINGAPLDADIVFLHFDELDAAGHSYGFSIEETEYAGTLNTLDGYVENLFNTIEDKRLNGEDWLFVVVSDHGGDEKGHGDASNPYINQTIFFAQHPSLDFKDQYTSNQTDIAPTVLDFLGISSSAFDCKTDGISLLVE